MKRFEIKNGFWIEKKIFGKYEEEYVFRAIKISEIVCIGATHEHRGSESPERYLIKLEISSGFSMSFEYSSGDVDEFNADLEMLKRLFEIVIK